MTTYEARQVFDACIAKYKAAGDHAKIAKAEICREYFTNAEFRAFMERCIWSINNRA